MKIKIVLLLAFAMAFSYAKSQEWELYSSDSEIKIEYKYINCSDEANGIYHERIVFKYSNLSSHDIDKSIIINGEYINNGKTYQTKSEVTYNLSLPANSTVEGNCSDKDKHLNLFSKMLNHKASELKKFTLEVQ